jgi:flavin-binding protein dodecin
MSVAKIMEITAESPKGFDDATRLGIERASKTVDQIQSAWVKEQKVIVENGKISRFRVDMKVAFVLKD